MITIKFQPHNALDWSCARVKDIDTAYRLICALNYTGFSFNVYGHNSGDITDALMNRMTSDLDKPVCRVASALS